MGHILVVDDDPISLRFLELALARAGHHVESFSNTVDALERLETATFDAIVSDIVMPDMNGIELLRRVRTRDDDVPVVLVTGGPSLETAMEALELGAFRYLLKPVRLGTLKEVVGRAVHMRSLLELRRRAVELLHEKETLLGDRAALATQLERAMRSIWIAFQPVISLRHKALFGYEALVRSRVPPLTVPLALLPVARDLDQLHELGRIVRDQVGLQVGDAPAGACVLVNLDVNDLLDEHLYDSGSALSRCARRVILEVTEHASLEQIPDLRSRAKRLRDMGFRIALDDLGAGYSGLNNLVMLEPEFVKLDMSLVRDLNLQQTKQRIIGSMLSLCGELDIKVISEGVETEDERSALDALGCDLAQGFLFSRPVAAFQVPAM